jgi:hypothetical protein
MAKYRGGSRCMTLMAALHWDERRLAILYTRNIELYSIRGPRRRANNHGGRHRHAGSFGHG